MNHMTRTGVFLGVAAVSIGLAVLTGLANRPAENDGSHAIGTPFFPDFDDPLAATALQVATFDEDASRVVAFKVEQRNGIWQIPSHHNYPADGEDRLAKTATSMLGVERGALVSESPDDHKRYGVLDPLDDDLSGTEGYGDRITLFEEDRELLDLIIGDAVEGQTEVYYVRRHNENQIYRARLGSVDLSTKFADWIEQDLLQVNSSDLVEMVVDPYHIDEIQGLKVQDAEQILLERKPSTSTWALSGIDETQEKEKVSVINAMSRALADLEIIGVRRKPQSLINLFRGEGDVRLSVGEQAQMQSAGFFVVPPGQFLADEGEVQAGTKEGVRYLLQFGTVFTGSDVEIEVGGSSDGDADEESEEPTDDSEESGEADTNDEPFELDADDSQQRSRYLFVSVVFDESLVEGRPEPPVAPTPPGEASAESDADEAASPTGESEEEADASDEDSGAASSDDADTDQADDGDDPDAADTADAEAGDAADDGSGDGTTGDADDTPSPQEIYEQELADYEVAMTAYEEELAEFEEKIEAGQELVDELNRRFAEWYYVISADLYEDLKVSREDLVEPADPAEPGGETDGPDLGALLEGAAGNAAAEATDDESAPDAEPIADDAAESSDDDAVESEESESEESDRTATPEADEGQPAGSDSESTDDTAADESR